MTRTSVSLACVMTSLKPTLTAYLIIRKILVSASSIAGRDFTEVSLGVVAECARGPLVMMTLFSQWCSTTFSDFLGGSALTRAEPPMIITSVVGSA